MTLQFTAPQTPSWFRGGPPGNEKEGGEGKGGEGGEGTGRGGRESRNAQIQCWQAYTV